MKTTRKAVLVFLGMALGGLIGAILPVPLTYAQSQLSYVAGKRIAANFNYRPVAIGIGFTGTGTQTMFMSSGVATLADGRVVSPFSITAPITVGQGGSQETVFPTAVSGCGTSSANVCAITASFTNAHGQNEPVISGTFGLAEAIAEAHASGVFGGTVVIDPTWGGPQNINTINSQTTVVYQNVSIEDDRGAVPQYWSAQGGATTLAAPATLTAVTVGFALNGGNATAGTYVGANTYHVTIACVDAMGQEGPGSADFSALTAGSGSTNQIGIAFPIAQAGCVGYVPYISLTGGTYTLSYKVPLVTQPATQGNYPVSNGVCTLTTIQYVTPACAMPNATYGQSGSNAVVSALTLNTSPIVPQVTVVSTTSVYVPNAGGRTTYSYSPGGRLSTAGVPSNFTAFTISAADATTVPSVIGTINLQAGIMNYVGRTMEVCVYATTTASTGTIKDIQFQWDAMGQNTAGKGVPIGDLTVTQTSTSVTQLDACQKFQTTVAGVTATAGSIAPAGGYITSSVATIVAAGAGGETLVGGQALLNLAVDARINIIYLHTTGTDGAAVTLQNVTVRFI